MSKHNTQSNDLVGDAEVKKEWKPKKISQGQIVKFVKHGNQPDELLEYAAIVASIKNESAANLAVVTDTHLEFLKGVPQSEGPSAGYFYVSKQ